jgi:mannose-6-phosphate isomerase-like protein (cupin superfamily)
LESRIFIQEEMDIGNLTYMDGGSNSTAINPGRLGDPVINYVHFPAGMYQTLHTHPSHRIGLILKGNGRVELDNEEMFPINEGEVFFMRRNELHNFITDDEDVLLFVFAPDSGTGPTDEVNPLKIRTYVGQQRHAK